MSTHRLVVTIGGHGWTNVAIKCPHEHPRPCAGYEEGKWPDDATCRCADPACPCRQGDHGGCSVVCGACRGRAYLAQKATAAIVRKRAVTSAHPLDTEILDLVEGTLERAEEERILAHLSICLLCRIKRQRLSAAAPVEFSDPRDLVTPAFAHIEVRHEDGSAARAGELWLTADDDGGMVLVRKVRSSGLVVVPVTLDVEVADDETLVLDEAASPLGLPLAIYERLMVSIPFSAISGRVIPKLDRIDLLALSSDSVGASRGSAIDGSTDPRLEIRQYLTDRLTALDNPDDEGWRWIRPTASRMQTIQRLHLTNPLTFKDPPA